MEALDVSNETSLIEAAGNLNKDALAYIFNIYAPMIYRYARRLGQDPIDADNIVGDVFARLLDQLSRQQYQLPRWQRVIRLTHYW